MKKAWGYWQITLFLVLASWQSAEALRCQNQIVSSGDSPTEVFGKCGPPSDQQHREEQIEIFEPFFVGGKRILVSRRITIPVEIWTYNFGPHELIYVLTFRDDRIIRIKTRGYGY